MAEIVTPRPAATILLLRDGKDGLEVFMVVRHHQIDFASGALVFPGGRVDQHDFDAAGKPALWTAPGDLRDGEMPFRIAAIRETFEECGVLLARPAGCPVLIGAQTLRTIEDAHRTELAKGHVNFEAVLIAHGLQAATDLLVPYAHWITPTNQPKRYDTLFYLAEAPSEHLAVHDGSESVDSVWISPQQAIDDTESGKFKLVFATELNLMRLAKSKTVAEAFAEARAQPIVTVLPRSEKLPDGKRRLFLPADAGYGGSEFIVSTPPASGDG